MNLWDDWTNKRKERGISVRGITTKDIKTIEWVKSKTRHLLNFKTVSRKNMTAMFQLKFVIISFK